MAKTGKTTKKPNGRTRDTKRRTWRKAKIEDVEEALEDDRAVDKLKRKVPGESKKGGAGGSFELFTVDTVGSSEGLSIKSRRELARSRAFPSKGPKLGLSAYEELKVERAAAKLITPASRTEIDARTPGAFDIWAEPKSRSGRKTTTTAKQDPKSYRTRIGAEPVPSKIPNTLHQKVSVAPAVLPAHEGQSMNPQSSAFEELSCIAAAKQLDEEREAANVNQKALPMSSALKDVLGEEKLQSMDEESKINAYREIACPRGTAAAVASADQEKPFQRTVKKQIIKSQAHRNRERKRKDIDSKAAQLRMQKKLEKSVGEIGAIAKQMDAEDEYNQRRREYREEMKSTRKQTEAATGEVPKCRRLGRSKFAEEAIRVPSAGALGKGLRSMPLGSDAAVKERVSSIMRRGMLPAPPEASASEVSRVSGLLRRARKARKYVSPLMKDNQVKYARKK